MKTILIFFGPPGSGKGTQAKMISKKLGIPVISTGEIMRQEIKKKTAVGREIEKILVKGNLAPDNLTIKLLDQRLKKHDIDRGFILDGFPRNPAQLKLALKRLKKIMEEDDKLFAVYINVSDREVVKRLSGRRVCICGETYHLEFNPPKKKNTCDKCGEKLFQRDDDKPEVVEERLKIYYKGVKPILDYFSSLKELIEINGEQAIAKVHKDVKKKLKIVKSVK